MLLGMIVSNNLAPLFGLNENPRTLFGLYNKKGLCAFGLCEHARN